MAGIVSLIFPCVLSGPGWLDKPLVYSIIVHSTQQEPILSSCFILLVGVEGQYLRLCRAMAKGFQCWHFCYRETISIVSFAFFAFFWNSQINIASFALGRIRTGGTAMSCLNLDTPCSEATLEEIRKVPDIRNVVQVRMD